MNQLETVRHDINPVFDKRSRVLLLGTMPSPASRAAGFFYGHPQNRFWRVLAALFDEPTPRDIPEKRDLLLRHRIALWDVLASCQIEGASDASIRDAQPNDLRRILQTADIQAIFTTGTKAGELYRKLIQPELGIPCTVLPSTSAANAKMKLDNLVSAYGEALLPRIDETETRRVMSVPDVARLESAIADAGTSLSTLMERAGRALAKATLEEARAEQPHMVVLCGSGNNGGDGWVAARELAAAGCHVDLVTRHAAGDLSAEPAREQALATERVAEPAIAHQPTQPDAKDAHAGKQSGETGARTTTPASAAPARSTTAALAIHVAPSVETVADLLAQADVIVDAILGTGFSGNGVRAPYDEWIRLANEQRARGTRIVAADVPSGLSAQRGKAAEPCIKAHKTITMITSKPGLETPYAFAFCGDVQVAPLTYIEPILEAWQKEAQGEAAKGNQAGNQNPQANAAITGESSDMSFQPCETNGTAPNPQPSAAARPAQKQIVRPAPNKTALGSRPEAAAQPLHAKRDPFRRAETEDDDGYDPYSDRPPAPEPFFEADPWA